MKIKVSRAQNNWFAFNETPFTKERYTDLHFPDMAKVKRVRKQLRTVILSEFYLLYLSLLKVIPEIDSI